ncbi:hypothetical protein AQUCO_00700464v1 [Aquilegia coerulea]|uniref:Dof zinc finger protein n=1 Tax=Aquilegia coerulea TaxID=218851 RepID=A0A2G5EK42_AQUCA|nr:hypothetical protein AQUCO_00700464v1 [Aquilegia coerulea]
MPSSDYSGERLPAKSTHFTGGGQPEHDQQLQCPRCDSRNTKFCYYNNYNLSQPRHYCKGCRRYWTHGGTLRDVPIGGGSRKNSYKRSRKSPSSSSLSPIPEPVYANPISSRPIPTSVSSTITVRSDHNNVHHHHFNNGVVGGSFTSLLNPQPSPSLLTLNGFGLGLGSSFDEMVTFETGKGVVWPLGFGENNHSGGVGLIGGGIGNTWQLGIGGGGGGGGNSDFLTWPEVGMSTTARKSVK